MCMDILVCVCACVLALFPGHRPASHRLQYSKAGVGLVHFPHMSDVTGRKAVERV